MARTHRSLVTQAVVLLILTVAAGTVDAANQPPAAPTINEPATDGQVVNPFDVHMVTAPFADPDPGDTQGCTDWQIVLASTLQPVWLKTCARNVSAFHIHLGDGAFQPPFTELTSDTDYLLRVRHSDNLGAFSPWAQRAFRTAAPPPPGSPDHKWVLPQPDYEVQLVATGFQLPVSIAFVPNPGSQPNDPFFYVAELYGTIKVVTRSGVVSDYATNLLNFEPMGVFPGTGEQGIGGILVEPATGDLFVSLLYSSDPADYFAPLYPIVIRLHSHSSGLIADGETTILDMVGETMLSSHIASNLTIGPDGKLYVHVGDGFFDGMGLDLNSFRGKILRMNLDGSAPTDNPFYGQSTGTDAKAYIYAYGFRNPFGGAWRTADGMHYEVEPGPSVDRFAQVVAGRNYGFDTTDASMETFALWNWFESVAPVNVTFIQPSTFAGSGFPADKMDHAFVAESGPTYATGPVVNGKRITEFVLHPDGTWLSGPTPFVEYGGVGKATVIALAPGPDGLYFSDFYKDTDYLSPADRGSNILRVTFLGTVDFRADVNAGSAPPLTVQFTDLSSVPTPTGWLWEFGDGTTSSTQHPAHTYTTQGVYDVRLTVTNAAGSRSTLKPAFIGVGPVGLKGEYFGSQNLTDLRAVRIDPTVNFDWTGGSPDPSLGSVQFSARWTGQVVPQFSELYTFCTVSDDGVRLWVNTQQVVDNWTDHPPTENCGTIALVGGQSYSIRMEYYQADGAAVARLLWSSASQPKQVIPQNRLYLPGAGPPPPPPTPLTVTINQAASQPDPTSSPSINFTVVFSASVADFTNNDVTITGTAGGTKTVAVTGGPAASYTVTVSLSGITSSGTVIASIAAGVAHAAAGTGNTASTSTDNTVTYNAPPPTPLTVTINQAAKPDPTSSPSINFTVVFSASVADFTNNDVTITGTAGGTKTVAVTGGPAASYTVTVSLSGITSSGTVIASIAAGVAHAAAGTGNTASTSTDNTVTYNAPPPPGIPDIAVTPLSLSFGNLRVGRTERQDVTVRNTGTASLAVSGIMIGSVTDFTLFKDGCSQVTLGPGKSCTVTVRFKPSSTGVKNGTLTIPSNDPDENPVTVSLRGTGI